MYFLAAGMIVHATALFLSFVDLGDFWIRAIGYIFLFAGLVIMVAVLSFSTTAATIFHAIVAAFLGLLLLAAVGLGENTDQRILIFVIYGFVGLLHFLVVIKNMNSSGVWTFLQYAVVVGYGGFLLLIALFTILGPDVANLMSRTADYAVECALVVIFTWGIALVFGISFYLVDYNFIIFSVDGSSVGTVPTIVGTPVKSTAFDPFSGFPTMFQNVFNPPHGGFPMFNPFGTTPVHPKGY
jgi:hypothetical protein